MEWDFNANQEIDEETFGKAPEGYKSAYTKDETSGSYKISDGFRPYVDAIIGLGGALKNERTTSKALKGQKDVGAAIKEALGFDTVEEAKAKFDELNQLVTSASKVDPAKIKNEIEATFNAKIADKDKELSAMSGTLSKYMVESAAVTALAAAKGNAKLLMPIVREHVELVKDGEEYVVRVKDTAGDYRGNGKGGFMSVEDLVAEMRGSKDYAAAFESDLGGGSSQQQQRPGSQQQQQLTRQRNKEDMNPTDRIQAGLNARRNGRR